MTETTAGPVEHSPAEVDRVTLLLQAAWAKAEPEHGVTLHPSSYTATFVDLARTVLDDRARLVDTALGAARILEDTADALGHLVMDAPADQAAHDQLLTAHRNGAAAIRRSVGRDAVGDRSDLARPVPSRALEIATCRAAGRLPVDATVTDVLAAVLEELHLGRVVD